MKKILILIMLMILQIPTVVKAQSLSVGIAKTRYLYGSFNLKDHFDFFISESLFSENFKNQQIEVGGVYSGKINKFHYAAGIKGGSSWNGAYQRVALLTNISFLPIERLALNAQVRPNYDTGYGYNTDWRIGVGVKVFNPMWLHVAYTTIPDYRKSEQRIHAGVVFGVGALSASAAASIPIEGNQKFKTWRVLMGLNYCFNLSRNRESEKIPTVGIDSYL